jgi:multiple sugar transport system ATP-binding protein
MGRALVREPQVFLMDEPLSNLDAKLRTEMRAEIATLQRDLGVTTMYVTHDQVEAMTMGTRIALMRDGRLQQEGPPQQLYDEPANLFVAAFVGSPSMNLLKGTIERHGDETSCLVGEERLPLTNGAIPAIAAYEGAEVAVGIRAEHLGDPGIGAGQRPRLRGRVRFVELLGSERLVQLELDATPVGNEYRTAPAVVTARFDAHAAICAGELTELAVSTDHLHFFDLETGAAIR